MIFLIGLGERTGLAPGKPLLNGHCSYFLALSMLCLYLDVKWNWGEGSFHESVTLGWAQFRGVTVAEWN